MGRSTDAALPPSRRKWVDAFTSVALVSLAAFGVLLLLVFGSDLVRLIRTNPLSDVHAYYEAGQRLNQGLPLYPVDAEINASNFYRYPPLLAIAFRPLALMPFEVAAAIWELAIAGSLVATIAMLGRRPITALALLGLSFPVAWSLALGQAQVLVTWLMAVASPASIALAGQLKLFPALLALYFVGTHNWAWLRRFALWTILLVLLQIVLEPSGSVAFLRIANLEQVGGIDNLSPYGWSPLLWFVLAATGALVTVALARARHGWAIAVWFATLVTPRLISYLVMSGLAALAKRDAGSRSDRLRSRP
jgi:hypothetical protein